MVVAGAGGSLIAGLCGRALRVTGRLADHPGRHRECLPAGRQRWPGHGREPVHVRDRGRPFRQPGHRRLRALADTGGGGEDRGVLRAGNDRRAHLPGGRPPHAWVLRRRGPATSAQLRSPEGVTVDAAGNLLIADSRNDRIRMVAARTGTRYGVPMTKGDIYTVAGGGTSLGDGGPATQAALADAQKVAVDGDGNLVIAAWGEGRIRVVAARTGTFYGQAMTEGDIYTVAGGGTSNPGDGGPATSALLFTPKGVAVDGTGNLLIADAVGERVRVVAASTGTFYGQAMIAGDIYTVAGNGKVGNDGDGLPATHSRLDHPHDVALDSAGNLLVAD